MKNFTNNSVKLISIMALFACSSHTFGATTGSRLFVSARAKAITCMAVTLPYAVTSAAYYLNSQSQPEEIVIPEISAPAKKTSKFHIRSIPPMKLHKHISLIKCTTTDTYKDCGFLAYQINPARDKKIDQDLTYISNIQVPKEFRRQGVATHMLQEVEALSKEKNIARLELTSTNPGATTCYTKFGFKKIYPDLSDGYCSMYKDISPEK
ncbi:MAG: GNAT family N-acetyltransferase [Candidatus Dependentiae bacterium]|nr:GNAT family N-acetyltransferase [Candidatus Dependentiae bacterium]